MNFVALFHGSISKMGWGGGVRLSLHSLAAVYLFVRSRVHWIAMLCITNSSNVLTERNVALLTAGVPGAVVGNWVQPKDSFSAHLGPVLVYSCSRDADHYVFNYLVCLNMIFLNVCEIIHTLSSLDVYSL